MLLMCLLVLKQGKQRVLTLIYNYIILAFTQEHLKKKTYINTKFKRTGNIRDIDITSSFREMNTSIPFRKVRG